MKKLHEYGDFEYIKRKKTKLRRKEKREKRKEKRSFTLITQQN